MMKVLAGELEKLFIKTTEYQEEHSLGAHPFEYYFLLTNYVEKYNLKNGLEVGTALGLTAVASVLGNNYFLLDTIEKHASSIEVAKKNVKDFEESVNESILNQNKEEINILSRINFINGRMFDILDTFHADNNPEKEIIKEKYDYIFLDAYVSRLNEVQRLERYLQAGGIFIVSNIRGEMKKSHAAKQYLFDKEKFELLELAGDTIFVRKIK